MGKLNINEIKKNAIKVIEPDFSYIDGKYLREFRMKIKFSQTLLADYLGVSKKAIEKWEQGKNKINPVVLRMIYLMEHDSKIFSLLKEIRVNDTVVDLNPVKVFEIDKISNDNSIEDVKIECLTEPISKNNDWKVNASVNKGGINYGTSCIWFDWL